MKANTSDHRQQTDPNQPVNLSMSAHDRSQQEDSNIFLLPMNDNLNISTIEDTVIPKLGSSSQRGPSRSTSRGKMSTQIASQVTNVRMSQSRFQSNPMIIPPSENNSMDPSRHIALDESEIISRSTADKRNIGHFLAIKENKVPLGLRETDNTIKYTSGDDDRLNHSRPIDLKDYGSYDYREEQDVVHSLTIKNQNSSRRIGRENRADNAEEEVKEITGSGKDKGSVHNTNRQEIQRVAAEVVTIRSSSANIAVRDIEDSALEESVVVGSPSVEPQNARRNSRNTRNNNNNGSPNQRGGERQNRANNVTANAQQLANQQAAASQQSVQGMEVRPYLRIRIVFFAALLICSILLWLYIKNKVEPSHIIFPIYPYFAYLFVEGIVGGYKRPRLERWQIRDHRLDAFTALTSIASLILVHLALLGRLEYSVIAIGPLLLSTTVYPFHSIAPDTVKVSASMFRLICTLQTALVTLKLDEIIEIDWAFVLLVALVYMGVSLAYCIIYGFFVILLFGLSTFRGYRGGALGRKIQFLGLVWYFLYYGISAAAFTLIVGISQANDPRRPNFTLLDLTAKVGLGLGAFLMVYSSIFFKSLVKFIFVHFESGGLVGNPRNANAARPRATISFQVENEETYFISLSSTYFLPLTRDFMAKNKENIDRIKSLFRDSKLQKPQKKQADKDTKTKGRKRIKIQTLKDYKKTLDEKLKDLFKKPKEGSSSPTALNKFMQFFSPKQANIPRKFTENPDSSTAKLSMSVGNLDDLEGVYAVQKPSTATPGEEEKLCYLCYAHPPDSILMNCGHGGFCYDCAISAIKAKNECMECRTKVDYIHKLDSEKNLHGIVKAVEVRKVIVTEPPSQIEANLR